MPGPSHKRVCISGAGVVSCAGGGLDRLWRAAITSECHIREGLGRVPDNAFQTLPPETAANRALALSVLAAGEAIAQAGWDEQLGPRDGLILATTTGQFLQWDGAFIEMIGGRLSREKFRREFMYQPLGELATALQKRFGHSGPFSVLTSACTAATQAIALAALWITSGRAERVLVGGVEVLCRLTCEGFRSLQLLSNEPAAPFDVNRKGINLSEGAAFLCLEAGARAPLARLAGIGFSTDGYHMTAPHPEGEGSHRAMAMAIRSAGLTAGDIDWIHAHGTGSQHNDSSEGKAIARLFGPAGPYTTSTKWIHGHALGASGALETALVVKAMAEKRLLKTRGLLDPDPSIAVSHPASDISSPLRHVLKNTLGFGGANAALVLSGVDS